MIKKGSRQGDPIFAYTMILVLEVAFAMIKSNKKKNGLKIFECDFFYVVYFF